MENTVLAVLGAIVGLQLKHLFYSRFMPKIRAMHDGPLKRLLLIGDSTGADRNGWTHEAYKAGRFIGSRWPFRKQRS